MPSPPSTSGTATIAKTHTAYYPIVDFSSFKSRRNSFAKCSVISLSLIIGVSVYGVQLMNFVFDRNNLLDLKTCPIKEWSYPKCGSTIVQSTPTAGDWVEIRKAYRRAVIHEEDFSLEPSTWANGSATGFDKVPIEVRHTPGMGRGLYATAFIPKETKLWDNRYTARIKSECEGRRFVAELTNDQACNIVMWGYVTDHGTGKLEWGIDLDPASFINEADSADQVNAEDRIEDPSRATQPGGHSTWSTRDIEAGEEILSSYDELREFGLEKIYTGMSSSS